MNDYIILDGKRYHTSVNWLPAEDRPMVLRRLMSGTTNVTFGPATYRSWKGSIAVDVTPQALFGSVDDLRTTYRKLTALGLTDHFGYTFTVVMDRGVDERSLSPMWTATDNTVNVNVVLIAVASTGGGQPAP